MIRLPIVAALVAGALLNGQIWTQLSSSSPQRFQPTVFFNPSVDKMFGFFGWDGSNAIFARDFYYSGQADGIVRENGTTLGNFGLNQPGGLALDAAENLYIAVYVSNVIQVRSRTNQLLFSFSLGGGASGPFSSAVDNAGNIYVSALNPGVIQKYDASGNFVSNIATIPSPRGLTLDWAGGLYVVSSSTGGGAVYKLNTTSNPSPTPLITSGLCDPRYPAFDYSGHLYVSNTGASPGCPANGRIEKYSISNGVVDLGTFGQTGNLQGPNQMGFDDQGNLFVADYYAGSIRRYSTAGVELAPYATGIQGANGLVIGAATRQAYSILTSANGLGGASTWTVSSLSLFSASERHGASSVYLPSLDRMILFGGDISSTNQRLNDLWAVNQVSGANATWTLLQPNNPTIPARASHAAVYDAANDRMIVYGGYGNGVNLHDVWVLTRASTTPTWIQLLPAGGPPTASGDTAYGYDPVHNELIVAGGSTDSSNAPTTFEVWTLTNANGIGGTPQWVHLSTSGASPGSRWGMVSAYDSNTNSLLLFSGVMSSACGSGFDPCRFVDGSVWILTHANGLGGTPTWLAPLSVAGGTPTQRIGGAAIYDTVNRVFTLFGGIGPNGSFPQDAWALSGISSIPGISCSFNLSATSAAPAAAASTGSVNVIAGSNCGWTTSVDASASWIKITSGASGTGNGTVSFSVDANPGALSRTGVITIAGQSFTVTQSGVTCFYSYGPTFQNFPYSGGSGSFSISAPPGCPWMVASSSPFISAPSPSFGSGNVDKVNYSASPNTTPGAPQRTGIISITGTGFSAAFTITEAPAAASYACSASATPATVRLEGVAELAADLVLQCSGSSASAVTGDLQITLNTGVTSRNPVDLTGNSETLLLIGEPSVPTLGVNAFRGKIAGANAVVFRNVPLRPASGSQTMRITNLRVNASQLGSGASVGLPMAATALVQMNASVAVPITGQQPITVATAQPSMAVQQGAAAAGPGPGTQTVSLTFSEQFATAFKPRIVPGQDPSQPGLLYNSESGFVNSVRLASVTGLADSGTRLRARITNIPGGTCVYAAVFASAGSAGAQLVAADANGAGGSFVPGVSIFGGTYQLLTCQPGTATATWEVISANPAAVESSSVTLLFQNAGSQIGQIQIAASLAPVTQDKFAASDSNVPVPRFKDNSVPIPVVILRATGAVSTSSSPSSLTGPLKPHAIAGGNVTLTNQIINDSMSDAHNVTIRSNLPPSLTLQPDICSGAPPGALVRCDDNGFTIIYPLLQSHRTINLTFNAQVGALVASGTVIQVTTTVASDLPVFDPTTATSTVTFTVESSGCSAQINASSGTQIPASGGMLSFPVNFQGTLCPPWVATANQLWLSLTKAYFETPDTVVVQAGVNTGPPRSVVLTIADQMLTITQGANNGRFTALIYEPDVGQSYLAVTNGDGTYGYIPNLFTKGYDTLRTGDFNGDGKTDLVVYNSQTGLAYIGMGNGDGTFSFQSLFWSPGYDFVEPGDLNGDGKTDFALYNSSTGTMYTAISNGTGTFAYKYTLISKAFTFVRLADFTGDGKADIFVYNNANGAAYLGTGDGAGGFSFTPLFISPGYNLADIGELNGDSKADLILYNGVNGNTATGISDGLGGFAFTNLIFSPGFTSVRLADYTGDGKADVTVYNKVTAAAYFGTGTGTGTFNFQSLFWSPNYNWVEPRDVNGDSKMDVILYNSVEGTEYTGISNGNGTFSYRYQYWGIGKVLGR